MTLNRERRTAAAHLTAFRTEDSCNIRAIHEQRMDEKWMDDCVDGWMKSRLDRWTDRYDGWMGEQLLDGWVNTCWMNE